MECSPRRRCEETISGSRCVVCGLNYNKNLCVSDFSRLIKIGGRKATLQAKSVQNKKLFAKGQCVSAQEIRVTHCSF